MDVPKKAGTHMTAIPIADTTTRAVTATIPVKELPTRRFHAMDAADGIIVTNTEHPMPKARAGSVRLALFVKYSYVIIYHIIPAEVYAKFVSQEPAIHRTNHSPIFKIYFIIGIVCLRMSQSKEHLL